MLESQRYEADDIKSYDILKSIADKEAVIETEGALRYFYKKFAPEKEIDDAFIQKTLDDYRSDYNVLFQRLYKKYVNTEHDVNPEKYTYLRFL